MGRENYAVRVAIALKKCSTSCCGDFRIDAKPAAPLRFGNLYGMVHHVTGHDSFIASASDVNANVARRVTGSRFQEYLIVDCVIPFNQHRFAGFNNWNHTVDD